MLPLLVSLYVCALFIWLLRRQAPGETGRFRRRAASERLPARKSPARNRPKPPWVPEAVIRYKALSPCMTCRQIAEVFNREYAQTGESVGKTYVSTILCRRGDECARLRSRLRRRNPGSQPRNRIWGLDLTGNTDLSGKQRLIFGVLDHGSRACLALKVIPDKHSSTLVQELIGLFRRFGVPQTIRVDNEACMTSRLMRASLALVGVRLQRTELHCPWQNGRIERLFGTLKSQLDLIAIAGGADLEIKLREFRTWYNHVRSHQNLDGRTPAEAWDGRPRSTGRPLWFSAWEGAISGWYFRPQREVRGGGPIG